MYLYFQYAPHTHTLVLALERGDSPNSYHANSNPNYQGQTCHFDLPNSSLITSDPPSRHTVNAALPRDVSLISLAACSDPQFHAIMDSTSKLYSYRVSVNPVMDPFMRLFRTHVYYDLNVELLGAALKLFVGTHDFRAFSGQLEQKAKQKGGAISTLRTIYDVRLVDEGDGLYKIDFHLQGALYKMVRNMVGTALSVARGDLELTELKRLLNEAPPRKENKSKPAPAHGLCLETVYYNDDDNK